MHKDYYVRKLPHIQPAGESLFVTFRVAGSLPKEVLLRLKEEQYLALRELEKNEFPNEAARKEAIYNYYKRSFSNYDALLDRALPTAHRLDQKPMAEAIAGALHWHHQQQNIYLECYCIMPNHVHLLVTLLRPELAFSNFIKSIKTFSAKSINTHLGRTGRFWQREYYDHLVRNDAEHQRIVSYILHNPVKAGLCQNWSDWPYTYLA